MHTPHVDQNFRSEDPAWVLLAELSSRDFLADQDGKEQPGAGRLCRLLQDLGMSPESVENIARTMAGFAEEARTRDKQRRLEIPGRI